MLGASLYGVLTRRGQARPQGDRHVREEPPPDATGWYGRGRPGPALKVALLGDSSAAGYGVDRVEETPGALLASGLAERADRRVYLREFAVGRRAVLRPDRQIDRALPIEPDVAVILIGANDVTHTVLPSQSVRHLSEAVRRLRDAGVDGASSAPAPTWARSSRSRRRSSRSPGPGRAGWPPPRRSRSSRRAAAPSRWARSSGPEFAAAPALLFGPDQFHPSADGYARWPPCCCPSTLAALGLVPEDEAQPEAFRGEGVLPVAAAAVQAVNAPRAPSSTAPRSPAPAAAYAASGSSCGTAAARPQAEAEAPRQTADRSRRAAELAPTPAARQGPRAMPGALASWVVVISPC